MSKSTRIVKRLLALFLIVLMSINTFGAVVGDNDGSAFITKAEFDSLKNDFQSQIDLYNTSIDSKIDGAIAAYLSGITVEKVFVLEDLISKAKLSDETANGFVAWRDVVETSDKVDLDAAFFCGLAVGVLDTGLPADNDTSLRGWGAMTNNTVNAGSAMYSTYATKDGYPVGGQSAMWWGKFPLAINNLTTLEHTGNLHDWVLADHIRHRCKFTLSAEKNSFRSWGHGIDPNNIIWVPYNKNVEISSIGTTGEFQPGKWTGQSYTFGISGLTQQPDCQIVHNWSTVQVSDESSFKFLDYQLAGTISGTAFAVDYDYRDYYHQAGRVSVPCQNDANNGVDLRWRTNVSYKYNPNHNPTGTTDTRDWTFLWTFNRQKGYTLDWTALNTEYYVSFFGAPHYKYNGIPVCKTSKNPGKLKVKFRFINKKLSTGGDLSPVTASYTYVIMDKVFKNGNLPSTTETDLYYRDTDGYNHVLKKETVNSGTAQWTSDWIEIEKMKIMDAVNGDYIFIKVEPSQEDQVVFVEVDKQISYIETT